MPNKIIIDDSIVEDKWQLIDADTALPLDGPVIVPLSVWQSQKDQLAGREALGIWLDSDQSPQLIADELDNFSVVAINFPGLADGRGFTYGRELREKYHYKGEVRAIGSFMRDQLFYLKRCGFSAFALEGVELESALQSFNDFSNSYQAAIDQPEPLFKRR